MDDGFLGTAFRLAAVVALVGANAFFVASEFSLVAMRRSRVEQLVNEGNRRARRVKLAQEQLDSYIAATQLGITLASLALGWVGEPALAHLVEPLFASLPGIWPQVSAHAVAVAIAFTAITVLHVVLGELVPKTIALQRAEQTALAIAGPLRVFLVVLGPFINAMNGLGNAVVRLIGMQPAGAHEAAHSEEELRLLVTASQESGVLEPAEEEMIHKVFSFADKEAHQVMVPRTEVAGVPADMSVREFVDHVAGQHAHTRLPVYEGSIDSIIGIIHLKDAVLAMASKEMDQPVRAVMRPVLVVPESIHIDELMRQLRRRRMHMAVLVDEFGGTAGIATMEDLLEEIVGEIQDEFDDEPPGLAARQDGTYSVDGMMTIDEFNQRFGQDVNDPAYDTIAGYVFGQLGRVAEVGDEVPIDGLLLRVDAMDGLRIASLRVLPESGETLTVAGDDLAQDEPVVALPDRASG
ncbi:MAG: HlyC/CorC family transporter [Chloroflexi bacterium]|nr:HlyC/CorC family transporter [Chloroflexota bacterium]